MILYLKVKYKILCSDFVFRFCVQILCSDFVLDFCVGFLCWIFVLDFCVGFLCWRKIWIMCWYPQVYNYSPCQDLVCAVFHSRVIWKNVSPKFIELCMETPCWCPSEGHQHGGRKTTETSVGEFYH